MQVKAETRQSSLEPYADKRVRGSVGASPDLLVPNIYKRREARDGGVQTCAAMAAGEIPRVAITGEKAQAPCLRWTMLTVVSYDPTSWTKTRPINSANI